MGWIRNIAVVLGSIWFFAVSCTTGMIVGPIVMAKTDAREIENGEELHYKFSVAAESGDERAPFMVVRQDEIDSVISQMNEIEDHMTVDKLFIPVSFLMSEPSGRIESESSIFFYSVIEDYGDEQLIELKEEYKDGDNTIWSRYKARQTSITPLSTRMFYFGYMFMSIPYVFGISLTLFIIGRLFLFSTGKTTLPNEGS
jgi:hypothetical protein